MPDARDRHSVPVMRGLFVIAIAGSACAATAAKPEAPARSASINRATSSHDTFYMVARLDVLDFTRFRTEYGAHVGPLLAKAGAHVLVASPSVEVREGTWDANWTVVIAFPSRTAAMSFYESAEYQPLKQLRRSLIRSGSLVFIEGFEPPAEAK